MTSEQLHAIGTPDADSGAASSSELWAAQTRGVRVTNRRVRGISLEVAECGREDGPLVILLHGFPDFWQGWRWQIRPLVEAGYRVLAPNQRGYGASDNPPAIAGYDLPELAADVLALADTEGRTEFRVVGHDWGGIVAWWVAAQHPARVARLAVLSAPHPAAFQHYLAKHPSQWFRSSYAAFFQLPWLPEALLSAENHALLWHMVRITGRPGAFDPSDRQYLQEGWARSRTLSGMLNYYRAAARRRQKSLAQRVTVPTLLLFGTEDPAEEIGLAHASVPYADDLRLVELKGAKHWIQREEAATVNVALLDFL